MGLILTSLISPTHDGEQLTVSTSMWWSGDVPHLQLEIDHEADVYYDQRDDYDQHQDKLLPLLVIVFSLLCTGVLMDVLPTEYLGNI